MASQLQAQLHRAASLFFDRLSPPIRQQLVQTFQSMDSNGDGRISLAELIRWARTTAASGNPTPISSFEASMPVIFAFVDADGNGTLDFDECKGLFFIGCTSSCTCHGCGKLLLESAYTCELCSSMQHSIVDNDPASNTFDLCSSCYAMFMKPGPNFMAMRNPKLNHPHRNNMVEKQSELADAMDDLFDQVQCSICKEYHRSTADGVLIKRHVQVGRGPKGITVCEWCIACLCSGCGNHFQGSQEAASRGRWAKQDGGVAGTCIPCRQRGIMGGSVFASKPSPQDMLAKIHKSPVFQECSTCKAKAKNGSLLTPIPQSTTRTPPSGGTFGTANPPNYGMPQQTFSKGGYGPGPHNFTPMPHYYAMWGHSFVPAPHFHPIGSFSGGHGNNHYSAAAQMAGNVFNVLGNSMGTSPLDMINMVTSMGNPLDMLNLVSSCSIM